MANITKVQTEELYLHVQKFADDLATHIDASSDENEREILEPIYALTRELRDKLEPIL